MLIRLLSELASVKSLYNSANALKFQNLLPFWTCKNISILGLTAFATVEASLFCQSASILPAAFTVLLTLFIQGAARWFQEESFHWELE